MQSSLTRAATVRNISFLLICYILFQRILQKNNIASYYRRTRLCIMINWQSNSHVTCRNCSICSSMVPRMARVSTKTGRVAPIRWALLTTCSSTLQIKIPHNRLQNEANSIHWKCKIKIQNSHLRSQIGSIRYTCVTKLKSKPNAALPSIKRTVQSLSFWKLNKDFICITLTQLLDIDHRKNAIGIRTKRSRLNLVGRMHGTV